MQELQPGTRIGDKYQLIRPIGRGGMGSVWEAVNEAVGKRVAIKLLEASLANQPEFMRRFELEAQAAALIDHPDIVDVLDTGTTEWGAPYMVMEFLQGITLRQLIKRFRKVSLAQAVAVVAPILDALAAAHDAGIVHRDLKPANIFLAVKPRPSVKILDFGISKFQQSDGMTKTGATLGTPAYMAPEQVRDSRSAGPQADLYSVGAILYAMLSGRPPFDGDSDLALVAKVLTEEPPPIGELDGALPPEACALIDGCLDKDPRRRPASAAQLREALLALSPPDDQWLFSRVRELTPTESKPSIPRANSSDSNPSTGSKRSPARPRATGDVPIPPGATVTRPSSAGGAPEKKKPVALLAGLGLLAVAALGVVGWLVTSKPAPPPPVVVVEAPPPVVPPKPAAPAKVELTLKAEPAGARWQLGEDPACNPCTVTREQGTRVAATVAAEGFAAQELVLDFDSARVVMVSLLPAPATPTAATDPGKKSPTGKPGKKPKSGSLELDETNPYR
jgi:serine/threonine-protein kinase